MPRYKLTLEYDGTPFAGWQKQPGQSTAQETLENAVYSFCGESVETQVAGRTDAGVHALGQTVHIDLSKAHECFTIQEALNYYLRGKHNAPKLVVLHVERVSEEFHARFSATGRVYLYRILNRRPPPALDHARVWHVVPELNIEAMQEAAIYLLGHHDFTSFRASECQAKSPEKTLDRLHIALQGEEIHLTAESRSFLHNQVRIMTGTLVDIGLGKYPPQIVQQMLAAKDRREAGQTAPACGLYLTQVSY